MFTNLKIEADKWPWSTLMIPENVDKTAWVNQQSTIPTVYMQNGIGSSHDVHYVFKDTYIDLRYDVERMAELSINSDSGGAYLI